MKEILRELTLVWVSEGSSYQESTVWINHKTETSPKLFHSHKMYLIALLDCFLQNEITDFPTLSYTQTLKRATLSGGASVIIGSIPWDTHLLMSFTIFPTRNTKTLIASIISFLVSSVCWQCSTNLLNNSVASWEQNEKAETAMDSQNI